MTLTYSQQHLPLDGSLEPKALQGFWKRLRHRVGPFRYFACGEYGDSTFRPHYHAIIFGQDFSSDRVLLKDRGGHSLFTSKVVDDTWGLGHATVGSVSYQSAAYVAQYVLKKSGSKNLLDAQTGVLRQPPFVVMSRRPGIGARWFATYAGDVFPSDEVVHDGRRYSPPRYYLEQLPEADREEVCRKRQTRGRAERLRLEREGPGGYARALAAKEAHARFFLETKQRSVT